MGQAATCIGSNQLQPPELKPLRLWQSLLLFGVPALLAAATHYGLWPYLVGMGLSEEDGYSAANLIWFVVLFVAALAAYALEGNPLNWRSFRARYRLKRMGRREWGWTVVGILGTLVLGIATISLSASVYDLLNFVPPESAPSGPISNVALWLVGLLFNILSEELWWRGFILPRQELVHGRYTWLLHGALWALFHSFKWWLVPFMMLTTWIVPLLAQRLKNTTPGLVIHFVTNGLSVVLVLVQMLSS